MKSAAQIPRHLLQLDVAPATTNDCKPACDGLSGQVAVVPDNGRMLNLFIDWRIKTDIPLISGLNLS